MKRILLVLLVSAMAGIYCIPAYGWGQEGHRIIAKIAYDHLNRSTRKRIDKTLGKQGIIYWSNWPDEIKSDTIYPDSFDWHFQDFNPGMSDSLIADALVHYPAEGGNLLRVISGLLSGDSAQWSAIGGDRMKFIVHLMGDMFCPMHLAHMDDKGGNTVKMRWFGRETNLHTVWDSKLIESQGYSYTEYAQMLEHKYGHLRKEIEKMSDAELLIRNYHVTEDIYAYQTTWDGNTYHYIYRWHEPMELQLYTAGIRLAQKLNKTDF